MKDYSLLKINLMGGIVSPGTLQYILSAAREAGIREVRFGARQQILMYIKAETVRGSGIVELKKKLYESKIEFELDTEIFPNIISSYCAEEVFPTGAWISEGIYKDIFDGFDFQPKLKVNISDFQQSFTPFFTGNLNFIASDSQNFWFLYIRQKQSNKVFRFPILIYTLEIPKICKRLEEAMLGNAEMDENEIYEKVIAKGEIISQVILEDLKLPKFSLPYYEGFNRYGEKTWLGIYRRNETFSLEFLQEICALCLETKIGQICTTPWKSLIIKGIEKKHRNFWDKLLGKYTINVRHAANELNWQVEDLAPVGLALKKAIIREFDEEDVRTFGLSFAVQTRSKSEVFGSVVIKKRAIFGGISSAFDIYHTIDFNPNTRELILFEKGVNKAHVPEILQRLTKRFYAQSSKNDVSIIKPKETKVSDLQLFKVHQCKTCFTIYDERFGDSFNDIPVGVKFIDLPPIFCCPICENDKSEFIEVTIDGLF